MEKMEQLREALPPIPATEPIYTRGNHFYQGNQRFMIRGICYYSPEDHPEHLTGDMLDDEHLDDLRRDIANFRELGLNTIQVSHLRPSQDHSKAMHLLRDAGIYVLVKLADDGIVAPTPRQAHGLPPFNPNFNTARHYPTQTLECALRLASQFAHHPNTLAFTISGSALRVPATTKIAEVIRALLADTKHYLRLQPSPRRIPVGVSLSDNLSLALLSQTYFLAGPAETRADFLALDSWGWMGARSSFSVSGWKNMIDRLAGLPAPMLLGAFGTPTPEKPRAWTEILSLYSPDMTGVFSGGCVHRYAQRRGSDWYDTMYAVVEVVEGSEGREVVKKKEFGTLKERFRTVDARRAEETWDAGVARKDFESWRGEFPAKSVNQWYATEHIPRFTGDWSALVKEIEEAREWVFVEKSAAV